MSVDQKRDFAPRELRALPLGAVRLLEGPVAARRQLIHDYLLRLKPENLLQNHLLEAARTQWNFKPGDDIHWGWESPTSMVRSFFVGHWLSAMSYLARTTGDPRMPGLVAHVVDEQRLCQEANGGEWLAGIPEKYLQWIKHGRAIWAPMYVLQKNLMGLLDAYLLLGNEKALEMVVAQARWFTRYTDGMTREELDDLLDWETCGIQEIWADLYAITGDDAHLELIHRFDRRRLFDRLLAGEDALTNQHANQTVPEIMGAARCYEVTGDTRWRDVVEAYWKCAVTDRGTFVTGGQTFGEFWCPPHEFAERLGPTNQEHCVVYNMMRLAERLLQWTGDPRYADYLERNRINGLWAQQHPHTGMVAYYLPLEPGSKKVWGTETETFWCCSGTIVQAHAFSGLSIYYESDAGLAVTDYVPSIAAWSSSGVPVTLEMRTSEAPHVPGKADFGVVLPRHHPRAVSVQLRVRTEAPSDFELAMRIPEWVGTGATVTVDGEPVEVTAPGSFLRVSREWHDNLVRIDLPTELRVHPIPDQPGTVAFTDGPTVLAGIVDARTTLIGDAGDPGSLLESVSEFELLKWQTRYLTRGQDRDISFVPLHEVTDERYTVYFPVVRRSS